MLQEGDEQSHLKMEAPNSQAVDGGATFSLLMLQKSYILPLGSAKLTWASTSSPVVPHLFAQLSL